MKQFQKGGRQEGLFGARLTLAGACNVLVALVHQSARQQLRDLVEDFTSAHKQCKKGQVIIGSQDGGVLRGWWEGVLEPAEQPEEAAAAEAGAGVPVAKAQPKAKAKAKKK